MSNKKCPWREKCQNGNDGCWCEIPGNCVRYLPTVGTHMTKIEGVVETPPGVDYDKFSQYFMNWIEAMGWSFTGSCGKYKNEE